jgi:ribosomal protein S18 acetylase RimI-like enzyme
LTGYDGLECRPIQPGDEPFLRRLFLETKEALAASLAGNPLAEGLLDMQFRAKQSHYRSAFPGAAYRIPMLNGEPVGCLAISIEAESVHIVDIAILKEFRGRGLGSAILNDVLAEATQLGLHVTLSVELGNPARRLYERLGFKEISRSETDASMRRNPS